MRREECFALGKIIRKHSFKGEIVAKFDTDHPASYEKLESIFLDIRGELVPFFIESFTLLPKGVRLKFEDIDDETDAENLVGRTLYLHESMLPEASEGEVFIHEIIGYAVIDATHGNIGTLDSVIEGKQDLLVVKHPSEAIIYIPWVKDEIVTEIDKSTKRIHVNTPEGLVELYLE